MRLLVLAGALGLAACAQGDSNNVAADNGLATDEPMMMEDPATTNLDIDANASAADQAINRTDHQSGLGDAAGNAADDVGNTVE